MEKKFGYMGLSIRLEAESYNAIKLFCEKETRSINYIINKAVRFYVEKKNNGEKING